MPRPASAVSSGGWLSSYLLTRNLPLDRARKIALGLSAAVMPAVLFVPERAGRLGARDLQPRVFRPAIVVDARHDSSRRHVSAQRHRRRRRPGRFRRRDGRRRVRAGGGHAARSRLRIRYRVHARRLVPRAGVHHSVSDDSGHQAGVITDTPTTPVHHRRSDRGRTERPHDQPGTSHEDYGDSHARRAVARQDRAAAAAFLHQPDGPAGAAAGLDVDLHVSRLADRRSLHRSRHRRHRQRRAVAAGHERGDRSLSRRRC